MTEVVQLNEHSWRKLLSTTLEGKIKKDTGNAVIFLINHADWRGCIAYDDFSERMFWAKQAPILDDSVFPSPRVGAELADRDSTYVQHWFARTTGVAFSNESVLAAIESAARANRVSPPRQYLEALRWDGQPRLSSMLARYFGSDASNYNSSVGTWWMISAVARIYEPGCKADCILILQGKQGSKKSTALQILGGAWYSNSLPDVTNKDAALSLCGAWIVEIAELEAMKRATRTAFKDFSARTFDRVRPPYGRFMVTRQRACVFAATTNDDKIFDDPTGARRFWPTDVALHGKSIDLEALRRDRDQLWAEAVALYKDNHPWWPSTSMAGEVSAQQDARYDDDVWTHAIARWCERFEKGDGTDFTTEEVMLTGLNIEPARLDMTSSVRVGKILRRLGYQQSGRRSVGSRKFSVYLPKREQTKLPIEDL